MEKLVNTISVTEFNQLKSQHPKMVVDFYADWCGPCKMVLSHINKTAQELGADYLVCKMNIDDEDTKELAQSFGVRSIPTFAFIANGQLLKTETGAMSQSQLVNKTKEVLG